MFSALRFLCGVPLLSVLATTFCHHRTLINCISSAGRRGQRSEVAGQRCNHKCKRANSLAPFDTKSELTPSRTDRSSVRLSRKLSFKIAHKLFQFQLAQKILAEAVEPENRKNKQLAGVLNQHAENVDINRTRSEWPKWSGTSGGHKPLWAPSKSLCGSYFMRNACPDCMAGKTQIEDGVECQQSATTQRVNCFSVPWVRMWPTYYCHPMRPQI